MASKYGWAANETKEARAIKNLKAAYLVAHPNEKTAPEPEEAEVKDMYIKYAGFVKEVAEAAPVNVEVTPKHSKK